MMLRRLVFVPQYLCLLVKANLAIAWLILGPRSWQERELRLTVPTCSPTELYLLCNLISFTPGSLVVDSQGQELTVHVLTHENQSEAQIRGELDDLVGRFLA